MFQISLSTIFNKEIMDTVPFSQEKLTNLMKLINEAKYVEASLSYYNDFEINESLSKSQDMESNLLIKQMLIRADETRNVLKDISNINEESKSTQLSSEWLLGMSYLGVTTHYRVDDSGIF